MKELPSEGQNFIQIRKNDLLYVDKTEYIYRLIKKSGCYFLSRPRRFGKSLLLGTMHALFSGHRELFKGLWIESSDYEFKKVPVLRLSLIGDSGTTIELRNTLINKLELTARANGREIRGGSPAIILNNLVESLAGQTGEKVVILIDEYDGPILNQINNIPQAKENRLELHSFYSGLKELADNDYIHFIFITGVTKFAKASVFSGLNNLKDLTLNNDYAGICGFTLPEFEIYFADYLPDVLKYCILNGDIDSTLSLGEFKEKILEYYNGYSWDGMTKVLNPFSLVNFIADKKLEPYWFESGTPTFLMDLIKKNPLLLNRPAELSLDKSLLSAVDVEELELVPLLFQTGYLTIDKVKGSEYYLKEPNTEVTQAFNLHIVKALTGQDGITISKLTNEIKLALEHLDATKLAEAFKSILLGIPYRIHVSHEHYYHSIFLASLKCLNYKVDSEVSEANGIMDLRLDLPGNRVFVIEFKYKKFKNDADDKTYNEALVNEADEVKKLLKETINLGFFQIENKGYAEKYLYEGKEVHKVAVGIVGRTEVAVQID
jgi:hypothetical protein